MFWRRLSLVNITVNKNMVPFWRQVGLCYLGYPWLSGAITYFAKGGGETKWNGPETNGCQMDGTALNTGFSGVLTADSAYFWLFLSAIYFGNANWRPSSYTFRCLSPPSLLENLRLLLSKRGVFILHVRWVNIGYNHQIAQGSFSPLMAATCLLGGSTSESYLFDMAAVGRLSLTAHIACCSARVSKLFAFRNLAQRNKPAIGHGVHIILSI